MPRTWFSLLTPESGGLRTELQLLAYDHAAAVAMRAAWLPAGYADALGTGIWPSCDVPPPTERARRGQPLLAEALVW